MFETLDAVVPHLPAEKPHYLMGVGKPDDLVGAVLRGIDMFDCVIPTRSGRNGQAFTREGTLNLRSARHSDDPAPLDSECGCIACRQFSRAYLHHVVKANEIIAAMLLTAHNLTYYQDVMADLRAAIPKGEIAKVAARVAQAYSRARADN
jgi:queuine tRNA-ribosyltransferase